MVEKDAVIERQHYKGLAWVASFFKSMKRFNAETEEFLEWMEISKTDYPQVMGVCLTILMLLYYELIYDTIRNE